MAVGSDIYNNKTSLSAFCFNCDEKRAFTISLVLHYDTYAQGWQSLAVFSAALKEFRNYVLILRRINYVVIF